MVDTTFIVGGPGILIGTQLNDKKPLIVVVLYTNPSFPKIYLTYRAVPSFVNSCSRFSVHSTVGELVRKRRRRRKVGRSEMHIVYPTRARERGREGVGRTGMPY